MKKFIITTNRSENYAAHEGFDGTYAWKAKTGSNYIVHAQSKEEAEEVRCLIEKKDDYEILTIDSFFEVSDDFESDIVKWQKESPTSRVIYVDHEIKKGGDGHWYKKRGYIVTQFVESSYAHLIGKFCGYVDDLTLGKCVMKIEGDVRERVA